MRSRVLSLVRQQPVALVALFIALGGSSYAAASTTVLRGGGSSNDTIHGCVGDNTGRLRIVDSAVRCGSLETPISFNREGRQGERGRTGRAGATGAAGASGRNGASIKGDTGTPGRDGAKGADSTVPGPQGATGATGPTGAAGQNGHDGTNGANGQDGANGRDGAAGQDGLTALAATAAEPAGANCANGGVKLTVGIDADKDHVLGPSEVDASGTRYVCDGARGATGAKGDTGDTGPAGPAGPAGHDGADGATETGASILSKLGPVDGSGSGLDADTVDGRHASDLVALSSFASLFNSQFGSAFNNSLNSYFGSDNDASSNLSGGSDGEFLGNVYLTANQFPPPGTAFAAGQVLPISQYTALFSLLGTTYGGDGQTNFRLPDLHRQAPGGLHYVIQMNGLYPSRP